MLDTDASRTHRLDVTAAPQPRTSAKPSAIGHSVKKRKFYVMDRDSVIANMSPIRPPLIEWRYLLAATIIAICGMIWRLAPLGLSPFWFKYGGSILWGAMVLLIVAAFNRNPRTTPIIAATIALAAELFRLYHTPALDAFRLTLPGALLFGRIFSPWNILAYCISIAAAYPFARPSANPRS